MIKLGMNGSKGVHKVRGNQYLTLMFISDATKGAKAIRIPKWFRFPVLILSVFAIWKALNFYEHVESLEAQVAEKNLIAQEAQIQSESKDSTLVQLQEELDSTKESRYEQLIALKELAIKLGLRLEELESYRTEMEQYKEEIDNNIGLSSDIEDESLASASISELSATLLEETRKLTIDPIDSFPSLSAASGTQGSTTDSVDSSDITFEAKNLDDSQQYMAFQGGPIDPTEFEAESIDFDTVDFDAELLQIYEYLDLVTEKASESEATFEATTGSLGDMVPVLESYPGVLPIENTSITSYFGYRHNPFGRRASEFHTGVDLKAHYVEVAATAAGKVVESKYLAGYGYTVIIDHGNGLMTKYAHNSKLYVSVGDKVKRGDIISKSGNTGRSTGPHLHYEILLNGVPQNPLDYIYKENK